jgi:endonuclease/exonuclease/phosphatase family metal-dependent hydrolase
VQAVGLIRPDGTTTTVLNTHLHHPEGPSGQLARLRQVRAILAFRDALPAADATILLGDLNGVPEEPALAELFHHGFRSATREAGLGDIGTFPSGLIAPTIYRGPKTSIDYILVSGAARVADARVDFDRPAPDDPGLYPSDHLGLVADLELSPG